jgi:hypothetical protein
MWFLTDSLIVSNMKRFAAILLLVVITCGIQASEPVQSPRRGIYIIDGKKVIKNHPASCY